MQREAPKGFVYLGKILKPHGIKGWLRILSFAENLTAFERCQKVYLARNSLEEQEVEGIRPYKSQAIIKFRGIDTRSQAETLKGHEIFVKIEALSREEDEYFWFELIGLKAFDPQGKGLGEVSEIMRTPAHDILVIRQGKRSYYIPMVEGIVEEINPQKGLIIISPMEGLLDINEM